MAPASLNPTLWIIAGANGVGKTTFAKAHIAAVSGSVHFVNLDLIAQGLSPLNPGGEQIRAARVVLDMAGDFIRDRATFALETTLSGRTYLRLIKQAKASGFKVCLLYFFVSSPEECLRRIARRVAEGGHNVPEADVRRRFVRSAEMFPDYARLCDLWRVYDTETVAPRLRAEGSGHCKHLQSDIIGPTLPIPIRDWVESSTIP